MRFVRKLVLLAMMAIAAMALAAPSAFAQTSTEPELHNQTPELSVRSEPQNTLCPAVSPPASTVPAPSTTTGGCRIHLLGTAIPLVAHVGGGVEVTVSTCDVELQGRVDAAGEGWLGHAELTQGAVGTCTRAPCGSATAGQGEGRQWSFHTRETHTVPSQEVGTVLFCLEPSSDHTQPDVHCEVNVPFTETLNGTPTNHRYTFNAGVTPAGGSTCHGGSVPAVELGGTFQSETVLGQTGEMQAEQNVEINHT